MTKRFFLLSGLMIWILPMLTKAQYADIQYSTDTADYQIKFWQQAADSLSREWMAQWVKGAGAASSPLAVVEKKDMALGDYERDSLGLVVTAQAQKLFRQMTLKAQPQRVARACFDHWKPYFEAQLKKEEMPEALAVLPLALTAMQSKVTGFTGASGVWFTTYPFAKKFGLQIDSYVDERREVTASTRAALQSLKMLYRIYHDWKLAVTAYVAGPPVVNKTIRRMNGTTDYYRLQKGLPFFARDVVDAWTAALLAVKYRSSNAVFSYNEAVDTIEVSHRLHFTQLTDVLGVNREEIRFLNPQYKYDIIPAVNRVYILRLPKGNLKKFNELEDSVYHYKDSILFNLHKKVILPPPPKGRTWARPYKEEQPDGTVAVYYHIKSGDNLGYIADWYDVRINQIEDWNNIYNPRRIQIGKKLKIYVPEGKAAYYRKIDKMSFAQKQKLAGKPVSAGSTKPQPKEEPLAKGFFWYTVKDGESPYLIAKKYPGVSADDILRWNNIKDPRKIRPGQKLKIKKL